MKKEIIKDSYGKPIRVKTLGQRSMWIVSKNHDVTFGIGPAGTGKDLPSSDFGRDRPQAWSGQADHLTRPAVEAGRALVSYQGILKKSRPLSTTGLWCSLPDFRERPNNSDDGREIIEIAPLAYMRGRTLDDAFVILDEAQNTTIMQMKMFWPVLVLTLRWLSMEILARLTFLEMSNQA